MMRILFRCDANVENGYGHFSRCLNIARGIIFFKHDIELVFVGDYSSKAQSHLLKYEITFIDFTQHTQDNSNNLKVFTNGVDVIILDSYKITQQYIDALCQKLYRIVVIDDFYKFDLSKVDLVINFCIDAIKHDYLSKDQALGVDYFPYKPELKTVREAKIANAVSAEVKRILVCIGGYDIHNVGDKIVYHLDTMFTNRDIIYLSSHKNSPSIKLLNNNLNVLPFSDALEDIYCDIDISITGGGLTKYESAYCCIPNGNIPQTVDELSDSIFFENENLSFRLSEAFNFDLIQFNKSLRNLLSFDVRNRLVKSDCDKFNTNSLLNVVNKILTIHGS